MLCALCCYCCCRISRLAEFEIKRAALLPWQERVCGMGIMYMCPTPQPTIGSFCPAKKRMTAQQDALHSAASHFLKCLSERQSKASEKRKKGSQKQISRARTADEKGEEEKRRDLFFFAELTLSFASKSCRLFMCWFYLNFPGDFGNVLFI